MPGERVRWGQRVGRRATLAEQCAAAGVHIVGIQEGRANKADRARCRQYGVLASTSNSKGNGGVDIWRHEWLMVPLNEPTVAFFDNGGMMARFKLECGVIDVLAEEAR